MDDLYSKILWDGFGIKNRSITRIRTGFICQTDIGTIELKKARARKKNLLFAHDVKEHLHKNSFTNLNRFIVAKDKAPFFVKDDTTYVVEEILPSNTLEETTLNDFILGSQTLGEMHNVASDIKTHHSMWDEGKLERIFQKRTSELNKVRNRIQKEKRYDNMDRLVINAYEKCMGQCLQAQDFLKNANYQKLFQDAKNKSVFCHSSFKGDNIRVGENGNIFVGGFEYAKSDFPIMDLCSYLKRFLRKVGGGKEDINSIIMSYHEKNPISYEESLLLKALAIYPEKFLRVINEHYNKRRCCVSSAMEDRLTQIIKDEDESIALLKYLEWSFSEKTV